MSDAETPSHDYLQAVTLQTTIDQLAAELGETKQQLQAEIQERQHLQGVLDAIVAASAASRSDDFFRSLVYHLTQALHVQYGLITELVHRDNDLGQTRVRTLAFWSGQAFGPNFEYALAGSPCEQVFIHGRSQLFADDVQSLFPQDLDLGRIGASSYLATPLMDTTGTLLGHLAVLDGNPMRDGDRNLALLTIFAVQAAVELERRRRQ